MTRFPSWHFFSVVVVGTIVCLWWQSSQVRGFSTCNIASQTRHWSELSSGHPLCYEYNPLRIRNGHRLGIPQWPSKSPTSSSSLHSSSPTSSPSSVGARNVVDWIQGKPLESFVSREESIAICRELAGDRALVDRLERALVENWDRIVRKLVQPKETADGSNQKRTIRDVVGEEATQRLLRGVQNVDLYSDPKTVNAFLQSGAINDLFAQTLYDGIYEFFQTIDVFGNIISNLPVLGPIRNKIRDDLKSQLDRTLGPTLRGFLRNYTRVAIERAAFFVLSEANRRAFGTANARLLESIMDRPLEDLLPESSDPSFARLRTEFFGYLQSLGEEGSSSSEDLEEYIILLYELLGDTSLDSLGWNLHRVLDASPTLESTANRILDEVVSASQRPAPL